LDFPIPNGTVLEFPSWDIIIIPNQILSTVLIDTLLILTYFEIRLSRQLGKEPFALLVVTLVHEKYPGSITTHFWELDSLLFPSDMEGN
jgi:hypothetical protein